MASKTGIQKINEASMSYLKYDKEEVRKKIDEAKGNVQEKMNKWANTVVSGWRPPVVERKEGEVWEDSDGRKWTVKDGIKQNISHLKDARMPWWCPRCHKNMNHRFDDKFYRLKGACFNCVVEYETKMRVDGVWEAYERRQQRNNERAFYVDKIKQHIHYLESWKPLQLMYEDGRYEDFGTREMFSDVFEKIREDIEFINGKLELIQQEENADDEPQQRLANWERSNPFWQGTDN